MNSAKREINNNTDTKIRTRIFTSKAHQLSSFLAIEYLPPTRTLLLFYGAVKERERKDPHMIH